ALPIPFPHRFGSFSSDNWTETDSPPIGEVKSWRGFSLGKFNPRYIGQNYCGAVALRVHGSPLSLRGTPPVDAEGVPLCCQTAGPELGGLVSDGSGIGGSWGTIELWLRNADLPPVSSPSDPFSEWPAAPLTERFGVRETPGLDVVADGSFNALQFGPSVPPLPHSNGQLQILLTDFVATGDYTVILAARGV